MKDIKINRQGINIENFEIELVSLEAEVSTCRFSCRCDFKKDRKRAIFINGQKIDLCYEYCESCYNLLESNIKKQIQKEFKQDSDRDFLEEILNEYN